jgi:RHS repeat-associated protein
VTGSPVPIVYAYTPSGNLSHKSDLSYATVGSYSYGANGCGPHAVSGIVKVATGTVSSYTCDANGNRSEDGDTTYVYDAQNQMRGMLAKSVIGWYSGVTRFQMAPGGDRYLQTSDTLRLVYGPRGLEKETVSSGGGSNSRIGAAAQASPVGTRWRHELGPVSVVREGGVDTVHTILRDRIGSTTSVAAANQTLSATRQFDPFGQPREGDQQDRSYLDLAPATLRGFTEHEHLSNGLIHMNGRVYDPKVGRFLSVDPIIQFPSNSQSLNPYPYILNNPFAGEGPERICRHTDDRYAYP